MSPSQKLWTTSREQINAALCDRREREKRQPDTYQSHSSTMTNLSNYGSVREYDPSGRKLSNSIASPTHYFACSSFRTSPRGWDSLPSPNPLSPIARHTSQVNHETPTHKKPGFTSRSAIIRHPSKKLGHPDRSASEAIISDILRKGWQQPADSPNWNNMFSKVPSPTLSRESWASMSSQGSKSIHVSPLRSQSAHLGWDHIHSHNLTSGVVPGTIPPGWNPSVRPFGASGRLRLPSECIKDAEKGGSCRAPSWDGYLKNNAQPPSSPFNTEMNKSHPWFSEKNSPSGWDTPPHGEPWGRTVMMDSIPEKKDATRGKDKDVWSMRVGGNFLFGASPIVATGSTFAERRDRKVKLALAFRILAKKGVPDQLVSSHLFDTKQNLVLRAKGENLLTNEHFRTIACADILALRIRLIPILSGQIFSGFHGRPCPSRAWFGSAIMGRLSTDPPPTRLSPTLPVFYLFLPSY